MSYCCLSNLYVYYNEQEDLLKFTHCCSDRETVLLGTLSVEDFYKLSKQELYDYLNSIAFTHSHNCLLKCNNGVDCNTVWASFNNKINTFTVAISRECNLNCPMCYVRDGHKDTPKRKQLYLDFLRKLDNFDFDTLKLTDWGEPLIYINEVLEITKQYKRCKNLYIITNGQLLTPSLLSKLLESFNFITIGYDIDSFIKDNYLKIRQGADFSLYIKNLMNIINVYKRNPNKIRLEFGFVEQSFNKNEIKSIKQFAENNNISYWTNPVLFTNDIYYH